MIGVVDIFVVFFADVVVDLLCPHFGAASWRSVSRLILQDCWKPLSPECWPDNLHAYIVHVAWVRKGLSAASGLGLNCAASVEVGRSEGKLRLYACKIAEEEVSL